MNNDSLTLKVPKATFKRIISFGYIFHTIFLSQYFTTCIYTCEYLIRSVISNMLKKGIEVIVNSPKDISPMSFYDHKSQYNCWSSSRRKWNTLKNIILLVSNISIHKAAYNSVHLQIIYI